MKVKLGTSISRVVLTRLAEVLRGHEDELLELDKEGSMGITLEVNPIKPQYTREEENGFHWLLEQWMKLDPRITYSLSDLKEDVCKAMWGVVRVVGPFGQERLIAARRTTRVWDHDKREYVKARLTREMYAELIDFTYRIAAEDGTVLPIMEASCAQAK